MRRSRVANRGSSIRSGRSNAMQQPCQNFGSDESWTAMSLPSLHRHANECELATRVSGLFSTPLRVIGRERVGNERDGGLQHVDFDPAAAAGALALVERAQDAVAGIHAAGIVGDGRAADLRLVGIEQQARHAAQRQRDVVVGRPRAVGAGCAEAGDRAVDQPRVRGVQHVPSDAEPLHHAGAVVLQHDVGARDELEQDLAPRVGAQVELHALLAAVEGDEVRAVGVATEVAERVAAGRFDLEHVGAEIGEHHAGERRGDDRAQFEHAHAFEHLRQRTLLPVIASSLNGAHSLPARSRASGDPGPRARSLWLWVPASVGTSGETLPITPS